MRHFPLRGYTAVELRGRLSVCLKLVTKKRFKRSRRRRGKLILNKLDECENYWVTAIKAWKSM